MSINDGHRHKKEEEGTSATPNGGEWKSLRPRGGNNATQKENNSATQKNEVGKQQHRTRKKCGKQHTKPGMKRQQTKKSKVKQHHTKKAASPLLWACVAFQLFSFGWWCFHHLLLCVGVDVFGCRVAFLPWVVLFLLSALSGAFFLSWPRDGTAFLSWVVAVFCSLLSGGVGERKKNKKKETNHKKWINTKHKKQLFVSNSNYNWCLMKWLW